MKICGIYIIRNKIDGRVYVGSSSNVRQRWVAHLSLLRRTCHHSAHLQRAWLKHGEQAFVFEVLESCSQDKLLEREDSHIQRTEAHKSQHGYNSAPVAGTTRGIKFGPMPEWHRRKIAAARVGTLPSPETRAKISAKHMGRVLSPEHRHKISVANLGRKMAPLSAEHRAIVSRTHKGKTISAEHRAALSRAAKGRVKTPGETEKRKASMLAYWATKRASQG